MYRVGSNVIHPEYGIGKFMEVFGESTKIAVVYFPERGKRFFALPSERLLPLEKLKNISWKSYFGDKN